MKTPVENTSGNWSAPDKNTTPGGFNQPGKANAQPGDGMNRMSANDRLSDAVGEAGQAVRATADEALKAGSDMVDVARQAASHAARAVASQASQLASNIAEEVGQTAEGQKAKGADAIHAFASALKDAAGAFQTPSPTVAGYVRDAAGHIDSLSDNLKNRSVNELVSAASNLARDRPVAFFAGAIAAGFAVSRLLKASAVPPAPAQNGQTATGPRPMGSQAMGHQMGQGSAVDASRQTAMSATQTRQPQMSQFPTGQVHAGQGQAGQVQQGRDQGRPDQARQDQVGRDQPSRPTGLPGKQW